MKATAGINLAALVFTMLASHVQAQRVFPQGIAVNSNFVEGIGYLDVAGWGAAFSDAPIRSMAPSIGQLMGLNPETGAPIANSTNLLILVPRAVVTEFIQARHPDGLWFLDAAGTPAALLADGALHGNGAGITNLSFGPAVVAGYLAKFGTGGNLTNSVIHESDTNVGIGKPAVSGYRLDVNGTVRVHSVVITGGAILASQSGESLTDALAQLSSVDAFRYPAMEPRGGSAAVGLKSTNLTAAGLSARSTPVGSNGEVDLLHLNALLVSAVKELKKENDAQRTALEKLQREQSMLTAKLRAQSDLMLKIVRRLNMASGGYK